MCTQGPCTCCDSVRSSHSEKQKPASRDQPDQCSSSPFASPESLLFKPEWKWVVNTKPASTRSQLSQSDRESRIISVTITAIVAITSYVMMTPTYSPLIFVVKFLSRRITLNGVSLLRHESDRLLVFSGRNPIQGSLYNKENILSPRKNSLEAQRLQGWLIQCHQQEPMSFLLAACPSSANQPLPHYHKMVATVPAVTYRCPSIRWGKTSCFFFGSLSKSMAA